MVVCGTRPEIIKMAPVYKALQSSQTLQPLLVHTGQHTDLATPLYEFFGMGVDYSIELVREKPTLGHLSALLVAKLSAAMEETRPAAVLVHGDTSSAAMAALAAFYEQIPVGHVEAGLRTYDKYSPFPEEMNRTLIGRMADWHFAPTAHAAAALADEALTKDVLVTGNTVVDAAKMAAKMLEQGYREPFITQNRLAEKTADKRLVLVTAHRRENWGEGLVQISEAVAQLLVKYPDLYFVWPLHANPSVQASVKEVLARHGVLNHPNLLLCNALDYSALIWLLHHAWITLTDSGGIQEEAAALGTPVLVLRDSTERPELLECGGGLLAGANTQRIVTLVDGLTRDTEGYERMCNIENPFGDGAAAQKIVHFLEGRIH